jgi:molybdate transport system ATP-binding protein
VVAVSLTVDARFARDGFSLQVSFEIVTGARLAVVGPNGAGKTTLLRVLAGLEPLASARVEMGETVWQSQDMFVRPEARSVGIVFQDALLFPHLSVRQNVAFGARSQADVDRWLEVMELQTLASRTAGQISGGEATRAAVARALARRPRLLLLDEPFSEIDAAAAPELRHLLDRAARESEATVVIVTHSIVDAAALADRVLVLEGGRAVQQGTVLELSREPRSRFVADLVGTNLYAGQAAQGVIDLGEGHLYSGGDAVGAVFVSIHPRAVALYRSEPEGSPRNVWRSTVAEIVTLPDRSRVRLEGGIPVVAEVTHAAAQETKVGEEVWVAIKASELTVYPG